MNEKNIKKILSGRWMNIGENKGANKVFLLTGSPEIYKDLPMVLACEEKIYKEEIYIVKLKRSDFDITTDNRIVSSINDRELAEYFANDKEEFNKIFIEEETCDLEAMFFNNSKEDTKIFFRIYPLFKWDKFSPSAISFYKRYVFEDYSQKESRELGISFIEFFALEYKERRKLLLSVFAGENRADKEIIIELNRILDEDYEEVFQKAIETLLKEKLFDENLSAFVKFECGGEVEKLIYFLSM